MIESISAVTLATHNMPHAVRFYRVSGFEIVHGDDNAAFTSFRVGASFLNLTARPAERHWSRARRPSERYLVIWPKLFERQRRVVLSVAALSDFNCAC
jgi:hypothetical protein